MIGFQRFQIVPPSEWHVTALRNPQQARDRADRYFDMHGSFLRVNEEVEEFVRQWAIKELIDCYGYQAADITLESSDMMPSGPGDVDVIVWNGECRPIISLKTRRTSRTMTDLSTAVAQMKGALCAKAPGAIGIITNGMRTFFIQRTSSPDGFTELDDLPPAPMVSPIKLADVGSWRQTLQYASNYDPRTQLKDSLWRDRFVRDFPLSRIASLTLEEYAQGLGNAETFTHRLEFGNDLGLVKGGDPRKWGVYWSDKALDWCYDANLFRSAEDAVSGIRARLVELLSAASARKYASLDAIANTPELGPTHWPLRTKPLHFYFPDEFLPIHRERQLLKYLAYFELEPENGVVACNRQLLSFLRSLKVFDLYDTQPMMYFLYWEIDLRGEKPGAGAAASRK